MNASALSARQFPIGWAQEPIPAQKSASSGDFDALVAESIGLLTPAPVQPATAWRIPDLASLANLDSLNSGSLPQDAPTAASPAPLPGGFAGAQPIPRAPEPSTAEPQTTKPQTAEPPQTDSASVPCTPQAQETAASITDSAEVESSVPQLPLAHPPAQHITGAHTPVQPATAPAPEVTSAVTLPDDAPQSEAPSTETLSTETPSTETPVTAAADLTLPQATSTATTAKPTAKPTPAVKQTPHGLPHRDAAKAQRSTRAGQDAAAQTVAPMELPARSVPPVQEKFSPAHQPLKKSPASEPGSGPSPAASQQHAATHPQTGAWTSNAPVETQNITAAPPMRTAVDLRIREKRPVGTDPKNPEESHSEEPHAQESHAEEERPEPPAATLRLPNAPVVEPSSLASSLAWSLTSSLNSSPTEKHNTSLEMAQAKQQADTAAQPSQYTAATPVPANHQEPPARAEAIPMPPSAHMDPMLPQKEPATQPLRAFSLEFAPDGARDVRLHVSSHGGDVHVALRSNDEGLSGRLRDGVHELVGNLSNAGYEADAWSPRDGGRRNQPEPAEETPKPSRKRSADLAGFEQMMQTQAKETL